MIRPSSPPTAHAPVDTLARWYTPDAVAHALVRALIIGGPHGDIVDGSTVIEPGVGGGAFVHAIRSLPLDCRIVGYDVDPDAPGLMEVDEAIVDDWLTTPPPLRVDCIVGNPPYAGGGGCAYDHACICLDSGASTVALLVRSTVLTTDTWAPILCGMRQPSEIVYVSGRVSFGGPAHAASLERRRVKAEAEGRSLGNSLDSDAAGSAWIIWRRPFTGPTITSWLRLDARDRRSR